MKIYLVKRMRLDLREFMLHVVWIHSLDLLTSWGTKDFDDLDKLVNTRFTREKRLAQHQFRHDTSGGPHIYDLISKDPKERPTYTGYNTNFCGVVSSTENQFGCTIVAGANV